VRIVFILSCLCLFGVLASAQTITRGPYLQLGTQTGATIRWRTDVATLGKISYGLSAGNLTNSTSEVTSTTEHEVRITGLTPDSKYFYSVGTTDQVQQQGTDNYFLTAPPADTKRKIRIASFGDCGQNPNGNQTNVRDAFLDFRGANPTDLWMLIGDNSYDGDDPMFQTNFFEPYQTNMMKNSMIFTVPGNHDYNNNETLAATHNIPYFSMFSLPTNAEAGGVASGTEEWYSFDYGPVHFVMLDGYGTRNVNGTDRKFFADTVNHPEVVWLKQDLAATTKKWKIVYLHFPPYTQGGHNSEVESDLIGIRQYIIPIFERFGVDVVMSGHSHTYERSYPLHDQYGPASDFTANPSAYRFPDDTGTGRYDGSTNSCFYKNTSEKKKQGTVYIVSGSSGAFNGPTFGPHPVTVFNQRTNGGSFYMEVEDNRLNAKFIQANPSAPYSIGDQFTIMKDVGITQSLTVAAGQPVTLSSSFISDYQWSSANDASVNSSARSITVNPASGSTSTYVVRDSKNCVQDAFTVVSSGAGVLLTLKAGNWNDPTVWSGNRIPTATDVVQLKHIVTIPDNTAVHAKKISYNPCIKVQFGRQARLLINE